MKQTKHTIIKGVALLLAVLLTFGDPMSALAAVPEAVVTDGAAVTDASDSDYAADALTADTESAQTEDEDQELSDEAKQALIDAAMAADSKAGFVIEEPKLSEEVLMKLGDDPSEATDTTEPSDPGKTDTPEVKIPDPKAISDSDFSVSRYANRIVIKNTASNTGADTDYENDLYGVVVLSGDEENNKLFLPAVKIPVGESKSIYTYYDKSYSQLELNNTADYELWLGRVNQGVDDDNKIYQYSESFIGYRVVYDDQYNEVQVDGKTQYTEYNKLKTIALPHDKVESEPEIGWEDGYTGITMKAAVQKNMTIKITWAPNGKKVEKQKEFKKYELYELTPDGTNAETGFNAKKVWPVTGTPQSTKKSAVLAASLTEDNKIKSSMLYLLKCYDATGTNVLGQYVTTVAPFMFRLQSGYNLGDFDFMFTEPACNDDMLFRMAIAANKKDKTDKNPNGFQDEWTSVIDSESLESYEVGEYPVNKKLSVQAVQGMYGNEKPEVMLANQYFGRIQTIAYVAGMKVTSAPSNVLGCKAGPEQCFTITSAGVKYDAADAKSNSNKKNIERANAFINYYMDPSDKGLDPEDFVHSDNYQVCAKSGLIYFVGPDDMSNIKAFDLLRCNTKNGVYKKVKTYKVNDKALLKCTVGTWGDVNLYAMQYTNFPYEQDFYYAVRAVSTVKGVTGGLATPELITPQMETIQSFSAGEMGADSISISWLHDDCVKEYWIYRSETSVGGRRDMAGQSEYIGKVAGKTFKSLTFPEYDDEGNETKKTFRYHMYLDKTVKANKWYYYYVRPVFNTKAAKESLKDYMNYSSEEYPAKASATFSVVKNFKASNYATGKIKTSFTQLKEINRYKIWRTKVSSNITKLPDNMKPNLFDEMKPDQSYEDFIEGLSKWTDAQWKKYFSEHGNWEIAETVNTTGKATSTLNSSGHDAEVGAYYFYLIQPIAENENGKSVGIMFSYSSRIRNMPLPVENVKAGYNGSGVSLSWNLNANDKNNSDLSVQIKYDGAWHNASRGGYYDDTLPRGGQRTYYIRVRYDNTNYYSSEKSITYSLPVGIEVSKSGGDGEFKDNVLTLEYDETNNVAQIAEMSARAYLNNGATAAYNEIDWSYNNDIFEITGSGNNRKIKAKKVGTATVTLRSAGIKKTFTVRVKRK